MCLTGLMEWWEDELTLPKPQYSATMAAGMAGMRMESLVPRRTSCRLRSTFRRVAQGTLETRVRSDFLRSELEDLLCAVRPCLISLVNTFGFPFSNSHGSCWWEAAIFASWFELEETQGHREHKLLYDKPCLRTAQTTNYEGILLQLL